MINALLPHTLEISSKKNWTWLQLFWLMFSVVFLKPCRSGLSLQLHTASFFFNEFWVKINKNIFIQLSDAGQLCTYDLWYVLFESRGTIRSTTTNFSCLNWRKWWHRIALTAWARNYRTMTKKLFFFPSSSPNHHSTIWRFIVGNSFSKYHVWNKHK